MNDTTRPPFPDRLSVDPRSPHHNAAIFQHEVGIKVNLEVSNLVREIISKTGTLTYQIGTRGANTVLRLKDGETQILAGLISDEDRSTGARVPLLGQLPVAGRLFGSQKDDSQPVHRLLGHPDPVQGDMEAQSQLVTNGMGADSDGWDRDRERRLLKEKGVWRMLLQVDSDERTDMQWGDAGRIYYWIRQADFAARRWNESWLHLQCF